MSKKAIVYFIPAVSTVPSNAVTLNDGTTIVTLNDGATVVTLN